MTKKSLTFREKNVRSQIENFNQDKPENTKRTNLIKNILNWNKMHKKKI